MRSHTKSSARTSPFRLLHLVLPRTFAVLFCQCLQLASYSPHHCRRRHKMRWRLRQECSLERADRQPDRLPFQVVDHVAQVEELGLVPIVCGTGRLNTNDGQALGLHLSHCVEQLTGNFRDHRDRSGYVSSTQQHSPQCVPLCEEVDQVH